MNPNKSKKAYQESMLIVELWYVLVFIMFLAGVRVVIGLFMVGG